MHRVVNQRLAAIRHARIRAEDADEDVERFVRQHGRPGTISGEKLTQAQHDEYRRLLQRAEAEYGSYAELRANTQ